MTIQKYAVYAMHEGKKLWRCKKNKYTEKPEIKNLDLFTLIGAKRVLTKVLDSNVFTVLEEYPHSSIAGGLYYEEYAITVIGEIN